MEKDNLADYIKQQSCALGFSVCGISPVLDSSEDIKHLRAWISAQKHGSMDWIERSIPLRENIALLLPNVKSVVVLALNYFNETTQDNSHYKVSKYAQNKDYHYVLKSKIAELLTLIKTKDPSIEGRAFVDSGPVFEKSYAVNAGLGWIGKNGCLILPQKGSYFFLGVLLLDKTLKYDSPFTADNCGHCSRCIDACPTHAIEAPRAIDARKCISYLTIEHRGKISTSIDFKSTNILFGCDRCQEVCPHNRFSIPCNNPDFMATESMQARTPEEWGKMEKSEFKKQFKGSPLFRTGFEKIKSNIAYLNQNADET